MAERYVLAELFFSLGSSTSCAGNAFAEQVIFVYLRLEPGRGTLEVKTHKLILLLPPIPLF